MPKKRKRNAAVPRTPLAMHNAFVDGTDILAEIEQLPRVVIDIDDLAELPVTSTHLSVDRHLLTVVIRQRQTVLCTAPQGERYD